MSRSESGTESRLAPVVAGVCDEKGGSTLGILPQWTGLVAWITGELRAACWPSEPSAVFPFPMRRVDLREGWAVIDHASTWNH